MSVSLYAPAYPNALDEEAKSESVSLTSDVHLASSALGHRRPPMLSERSAHRDKQIIDIAISPHVCRKISLQAVEAHRTLNTSIEKGAFQMAIAGEAILREMLPVDALEALSHLPMSPATTLVILRRVASLRAPNTPVDGFVEDELLAAQDILLAGAMRLAGSLPRAFSFENQGRVGRNVVASPLHRGITSSHGYDVELYWHQDNCGQPFEGETRIKSSLPPMPKQLGFFAIRNSEQIPTRVLLVDDVLSFLDKETIDALQDPSYYIGSPESVAVDGHGKEHIDMAPILWAVNGEMLMRYDPVLVSAKRASSLLANARLIVALSEATPRARDVILQAGDIMIFKNYRLLHMRVAFDPCEARRSRWLRRFYGCSPA